MFWRFGVCVCVMLTLQTIQSIIIRGKQKSNSGIICLPLWAPLWHWVRCVCVCWQNIFLHYYTGWKHFILCIPSYCPMNLSSYCVLKANQAVRQAVISYNGHISPVCSHARLYRCSVDHLMASPPHTHTPQFPSREAADQKDPEEYRAVIRRRPWQLSGCVYIHIYLDLYIQF